MKAALRQAAEIKRQKAALQKTESACLRRDYGKSIKRLERELREYCGYRNLDYKAIIAQ